MSEFLGDYGFFILIALFVVRARRHASIST